MKCLMCPKDLTNPKAKFCSDAHRMAYKRGAKTRTEVMVPVKVNPNIINPNKKPEQEWDPDVYYDGGITEEVLANLGEIYKKFEKENKGIICQPYMIRGERVLTAWERMKLRETHDSM